jgi:hypothetical protein
MKRGLGQQEAQMLAHPMSDAPAVPALSALCLARAEATEGKAHG